mgnify:CR=1 FL=1
MAENREQVEKQMNTGDGGLAEHNQTCPSNIQWQESWKSLLKKQIIYKKRVPGIPRYDENNIQYPCRSKLLEIFFELGFQNNIKRPEEESLSTFETSSTKIKTMQSVHIPEKDKREICSHLQRKGFRNRIKESRQYKIKYTAQIVNGKNRMYIRYKMRKDYPYQIH